MEQLLTPEQASEYLQISKYTLLYGSLKDEIPKVNIRPHKPRYRPKDIQNYIQKKLEVITCVR